MVEDTFQHSVLDDFPPDFWAWKYWDLAPGKTFAVYRQVSPVRFWLLVKGKVIGTFDSFDEALNSARGAKAA